MRDHASTSPHYTTRTCEHCGKTFTIGMYRVRSGGGRFCSRACFHQRGEDETRTCEHCGKPFTLKAWKLRNRVGRFCSPECRMLNQNPTGVTRVMRNGYVVLHFRGGRRIFEHRHLMEQHLGRKLLTHEDVHHRNGVRNDNSLENLEVLTKAEHTLRHAGEKRSISG